MIFLILPHQPLFVAIISSVSRAPILLFESFIFPAIMAMFFAIELEKAKVERVVTWILVAYVIFHVFSHIVLR